MEVFPLAAGTTLTLVADLIDADGVPMAYSSLPPIAARVWPGGNQAESFAIVAAWSSPEPAQVTLQIAAASTVDLAPGRYRGQLTLYTVNGPVVGYEWLVDVQPAPGDEPEPPTYGDYADLLAYGRSWLPGLQVDGDQAGFAAQRGRARSWLDGMILDASPSSGRIGLGDPGYGAIAWGGASAGNPWVRDQLAADRLVRRGWVIEATSKMALALICEGQVGPGDAGKQFGDLGRLYRHQARTLAMTSTAELADASGAIIYRVNIASRSTR